MENPNTTLTDETRASVKNLSKSMLRLHKTLLDAAKLDYENQYGTIQSANQYLQLVIDDPHFAWLRKISSLIALLDEAVSVRRPASEDEARGLFNQAKLLLYFEDGDEKFNDQFQNTLQKNPDSVVSYNETISLLK